MKPPIMLSKHKQVDRDRTKALVAIGFASVALVSGFIVARAFWSQANYLNKVADQKEAAVEQLNKNKESIDQLKKSYAEFIAGNPNIIGGSATGTDLQDGDNAKLVLDALPSTYDYPAFVTSVEALIRPNKITEIKGVDDVAQQSLQDGAPTAVEMPITVTFTTSYDGFKNVMELFRRSIRPLKVNKLILGGTNNELDVTIEVASYFQSGTTMRIERNEVQ
jgi:hypothetical protein